MSRRSTDPLQRVCVLSIGGLDPGGGAGLLADARAISFAGAFACGVAAMLTVQSTSGLVSSYAIPSARVAAQAREVLASQRVGAIKTGALGSAANVRIVASILAKHPDLPVIVDPVLMPSRGRGRLLPASAMQALRSQLIPRATLVTANVPEAEALTGSRISTLDQAHEAARLLVRMGAQAALIKGGHMSGREAVDVLVTVAEDEIELRLPRLQLGAIHGGGCVLAALICARLATGGAPIAEAVRWAKKAHFQALSHLVDVGGEMRVLVP